MRVLVVDNYDSFTYNLVQYVGMSSHPAPEIEVVRNDHATVSDLLIRGYDRVIVSPGPCTPDDAGISQEAVRRFPEAGIATLGVCLGHQALVQAWGGRVVTHHPVHGKDDHASSMANGRTIFRACQPPLEVAGAATRSSPATRPSRTSWSWQRNAATGIADSRCATASLPAEGVQFHPESVLTQQGRRLLANFLAQQAPVGGPVPEPWPDLESADPGSPW